MAAIPSEGFYSDIATAVRVKHIQRRFVGTVDAQTRLADVRSLNLPSAEKPDGDVDLGLILLVTDADKPVGWVELGTVKRTNISTMSAEAVAWMVERMGDVDLSTLKFDDDDRPSRPISPRKRLNYDSSKSVADYMEPISLDRIVSAELSCYAALDVLGKQMSLSTCDPDDPLFLVFGGATFTGTVHFADFFKPAGRVCLFALVTELESAALQRCLDYIPECWKALSNGRKGKAVRRLLERRRIKSGTESFRVIKQYAELIEKHPKLAGILDDCDDNGAKKCHSADDDPGWEDQDTVFAKFKKSELSHLRGLEDAELKALLEFFNEMHNHLAVSNPDEYYGYGDGAEFPDGFDEELGELILSHREVLYALSSLRMDLLKSTEFIDKITMLARVGWDELLKAFPSKTALLSFNKHAEDVRNFCAHSDFTVTHEEMTSFQLHDMFDIDDETFPFENPSELKTFIDDCHRVLNALYQPPVAQDAPPDGGEDG